MKNIYFENNYLIFKSVSEQPYVTIHMPQLQLQLQRQRQLN